MSEIKFLLCYYSEYIASSLGRPKKILVPCEAYTVTVQANRYDELNILESTVLKLSEFMNETDKLAEFICFGSNLVKFIQDKLCQMGYLDRQYQITDSGRNYITKSDKKSVNRDNHVFMIFKELLTGSLLPCVLELPLEFQEIISVEGNRVNFKLSSSKTDFAETVKWQKSKSGVSPKISEVEKLFKNFKKIDLSFNYRITGATYTVSEQPELMHVVCSAYIQKGDNGFLVTNGFSGDISYSLTEYFQKNNTQFVEKLKKQAVQEQADGNDSGKQSANRLPLLVKLANEINVPHQEEAVSFNKIKKKQMIQENLLIKIYSLFENMLHEYLQNCSYLSFDALLQSFTPGQGYDFYKQLIEQIGFNYSKDVQKVLTLQRGKLKNIQNMELQALLVLLLFKYHNEFDIKIDLLAKKHPDFFIDLVNLKHLRGNLAHMADVGSDDLIVFVDFYKKLVFSVMGILFPEYKQLSEPVTRQDGNVDQERLKADILINTYLGEYLKSQLSPRLYEGMLRMFMVFNEIKHKKCERAIGINNLSILLAGIFQELFFSSIEKLSEQVKGAEINKTMILNCLVTTPFYKNTAMIPPEISKVSAARISKTFQLKETTLGACFLVFAYMVGKDVLDKFYEKDVAFVDFISQIIRNRGHGSSFEISLSDNEIEKLFEEAFLRIKLIQEIVGCNY